MKMPPRLSPYHLSQPLRVQEDALCMHTLDMSSIIRQLLPNNRKHEIFSKLLLTLMLYRSQAIDWICEDLDFRYGRLLLSGLIISNSNWECWHHINHGTCVSCYTWGLLLSNQKVTCGAHGWLRRQHFDRNPEYNYGRGKRTWMAEWVAVLIKIIIQHNYRREKAQFQPHLVTISNVKGM